MENFSPSPETASVYPVESLKLVGDRTISELRFIGSRIHKLINLSKM
jgi:hypothetical protein